MNAEQLIVQFHELTSKKIPLEKSNKGLYCEKVKNKSETSSCIGRLVEHLRAEGERVPEEVFSEILSKNGCRACIQVWENKREIKFYTKQIGSTKNKMHALAKRLSK